MDRSLKTNIISNEDLDYRELLSKRFSTSYEPLYECYLGAQPKRADVSLLFLNVINRQDPFKLNQNDTVTDAPERETWQKIYSFFKQWRTGSSQTWKHWINYVWMEFDNDETPANEALPNLFFNTCGGAIEDINQLAKSMRSKHSLEVTNEALEYLTSAQLPTTIKNRLNHAFLVLPEDAHVGDVGIMFPRNPNQIKLVIRDIEIDDTVDYLSELNLDKSFAASIVKFCKSCSNCYDMFRLSIDIGLESISTRVGIEFFVNNGSQFKEKWTMFFNYLVDNNLCVTDKRDAVLQFIETVGKCETISHAKVVFTPGKSLEAKAYFYNLQN